MAPHPEVPPRYLSIARLHGEACIVCGAVTLPLSPCGAVSMHGHEWQVMACADHAQQALSEHGLDAGIRTRVGSSLACRAPRSQEMQPASGDLIAQRHMDQLVAKLTECGLRVAARLPALTIKNPAVSSQDPHGQQVVIRNYEGSGLTWCWVWPASRAAMFGEPTPPPEVEPMCPAEEVDHAARLIVNVVRLRDPQVAVGIDDAEHPSGCTCRRDPDVRTV